MTKHLETLETIDFRDLVIRSQLSQDQVASLLGRSRKTINEWFKGHVPVRPRDIEYLQFKLGVKTNG